VSLYNLQPVGATATEMQLSTPPHANPPPITLSPLTAKTSPTCARPAKHRSQRHNAVGNHSHVGSLGGFHSLRQYAYLFQVSIHPFSLTDGLRHVVRLDGFTGFTALKLHLSCQHGSHAARNVAYFPVQEEIAHDTRANLIVYASS
jgi:hypothetical protein